MSFTGGFHPLPRAQFALALPLGAEAEGEWLDLELAEWQDPSWVRQRLQAQLPPGFALMAVSEVPVSGPSLSQELAEARWRLELMPVLGQGGDAVALPSPEAWQAAVAALLASDSWIWHDTDKKGRPRSRECRPDLLDLTLRMEGPDRAELAYGAAIDPAGRSLRPEQLQHWFEQHLGQPLALIRLCRESLRLRHS